jgi:hypothetical protein
MMWIRMLRREQKNWKKTFERKKFEFFFVVNVTSCDVMRTKEFWMLSRWRHPSDAMSMPWNVMKVTLHSSSHYPSDAMSMPMSKPWNVIKVTLHSSSHYPSDAMSMQCPCHGCCQGDITHRMQCPCYGMWSRWQHSRWHSHVMQCHFVTRWFLWNPSLKLLFTLMTTQQPSLDQCNHSMCTLHIFKAITPRLLVRGNR